MKVLLIAVPLMEDIDGDLVAISMDRIKSSPPLGVYWLAGLVRETGYEVEVLDLIAHGAVDVPRLLEYAGRCDVVGVSCNSLNWPTARLVVKRIKHAYPDLRVVLGGIHPSGYGEHVLRQCPADYVIAGEGEVPFLQFLEALRGQRRFDEVLGLGLLDGGRFVSTPNAGLASVRDIEALPDPAYDLLPHGVYETLSVESARGCKFKCTFCSTKFLGSWRGISANNFVDRLERLSPFLKRTRYGVFSIIDDLYTLNIDRVFEITDLIQQRGLRVRATLDARATDVIRGRVAEALAPITNHMLIGAECGYDEGLKRVGKGCTTKVLERAASMLHDVGLAPHTVFSFVIGFPFEKREDCIKTIEFASHLLVKYNVRVYLQWYNTIPGSALWEELHQEGLLDISMYDDFGFFSSAYLFRAGVKLPLNEIKELSDIIESINAMLLFTQPAEDIIQFAPPEWLFQKETVNFPSHGVLANGVRPEPPPPLAQRSRADVAGLVGLHRDEKTPLPMAVE